MAGRRVWVVGAFDSFFKSARRYANLLEREGAQIDHRIALVRVGQLSDEQRRHSGVPLDTPTLPLVSIAVEALAADVSVILVALDGLRTRRLTLAIREEAVRSGKSAPVLISFYPGLIFRFHLEGMMSRSSCDLVLLNSRSDQALYREAMAAMGKADNSLLAGLSFIVSEPSPIPPVMSRKVVFAGQPTVPASRTERKYVVHALADAARAHPDIQWVIKPRHRPTETTLHKDRHHFEDLLRLVPDVPANLVVSYESMDAQLRDCMACITFSSTAALEAVARGVPARILTDLGIHENIGNHFFIGSGMFAQIKDLAPPFELRLDAAWAEQHGTVVSGLEGRFLERVDTLLADRRAPARDEAAGMFGRCSEYTSFHSREGDGSSLADFGAAAHPVRTAAANALQAFLRILGNRPARRPS